MMYAPGCYGKAGFNACGVIWFQNRWVFRLFKFRVVGIGNHRIHGGSASGVCSFIKFQNRWVFKLSRLRLAGIGKRFKFSITKKS